MEYAFMLLGLGFFLYVIYRIERADEKRQDQKMAERREFGPQYHSEDKLPKKFRRHS